MKRVLAPLIALCACNAGSPSDHGGDSDVVDVATDSIEDPADDNSGVPDLASDVEDTTDVVAFPTGPRVEGLCLGVAQRVCDDALECDCAAREALGEEVARDRCMRRVVEDCLRNHVLPGRPDETDALIEAGTLVVDPDAAAACLDAIDARLDHCRSDGTVVGHADPVWSVSFASCGLAIASTEPIGEPCVLVDGDDYPCASGRGACHDGTCRALASAGEPCAGEPATLCAPGLSCVDTCVPVGSLREGDECQSHDTCEASLWCWDGQCRQFGREFAGCRDDADCAAGFACTGVGVRRCTPVLHDACQMDGVEPRPDGYVGCGAWSSECQPPVPTTCVPYLGEGTSCGAGDRCEPGMLCRPTNPSGTVCLPGCEYDWDCADGDHCVLGDCRAALPGIGEECEPGGCAEGLWCRESVADALRCTDLLPAEGEPCTPNDGSCEQGLVCRSDDGTCIAPPSLGDPCDGIHPNECAAPSVCDGSTCVAVPGEGEDCIDGRCAEGLYCIPGDSWPTRTCVADAPLEGDHCDIRIGDCGDLFCVDGRCQVSVPGQGDSCTTPERQCAEGLDCYQFSWSTQCWAAAELGDPCPFRGPSQWTPCPDGTICECEGAGCACVGDECEQPVCRLPREPGERCTDGYQCAAESDCVPDADSVARCVPVRTENEPCGYINGWVRHHPECADDLYCGGPGLFGTCELTACRLFLDY